ncbi:MAG: phosphoribosylglycinamide formyltransferase [Spirulinaceae cyanobacterium SM2_1_0]|nr:phosphoribosylglycinamide formyltransferase [Spirulinaceae cyanobacterium SM2_1_0]
MTEPAATPSAIVSPPVAALPKFDPPLALGVLASGSGSNFAAIAQAITNGGLQAEIRVLIYNNPGVKVAERAAELGIPAILLNHRHFRQREDLDREIVRTLQQHGVEWVVMAGWMRIVTPVLLDAYDQRVINIHPSLLPSFPGIHAIEQALAAGVKIAGCTAHIACLKVDSGPILLQAAVPVFPADTPASLHARVQVQEHRILPAAIALAAQQAGQR